MSNLTDLAKDLIKLEYVVQRNWENLPESVVVDGHDDLDLFVADQDKEELLAIIKNYPDVHIDVRTPTDNYYPRDIALHLLENRRQQGGFWIPSTMMGFLAIYYHNLVHKKDRPYQQRLDVMFLEMFQPVKPVDQGVGFYDLSGNPKF